MTQSHRLSNCVQIVTILVNFWEIEFEGSCCRGDRCGQLQQHVWQVCVARSACGDFALITHDRSRTQLDSRRHPKLMKTNGFSLISIDFH